MKMKRQRLRSLKRKKTIIIPVKMNWKKFSFMSDIAKSIITAVATLLSNLLPQIEKFSNGIQQLIIWVVAGIIVLILLIVFYFGVKTESVRKLKKKEVKMEKRILSV